MNEGNQLKQIPRRFLKYLGHVMGFNRNAFVADDHPRHHVIRQVPNPCERRRLGVHFQRGGGQDSPGVPHARSGVQEANDDSALALARARSRLLCG